MSDIKALADKFGMPLMLTGMAILIIGGLILLSMSVQWAWGIIFTGVAIYVAGRMMILLGKNARK